MNVTNDLQGLQGLFPSQGIQQTASATHDAAQPAASAGTDEATLSAAGTMAAQTTSAPDVRTEKVAQVQQALAAGTYNVPSSAVADKMIGRMLGE